jgi:hypothetical protein
VVGGVSKNGGGEPKNRWEGGVALAAVWHNNTTPAGANLLAATSAGCGL